MEEDKSLLSISPVGVLAASGAAVLVSVGGALTPVLLGVLAVLTMASQLDKEQVRRLRDRALRPQYWFLSSVSDTARGLTNAYPKIAQLWGLPESGQELFARRSKRENG